MLLCLSSREFREVLLVAFGKVAVVYEASFDTDAARLSAVKARTVAINQIKRLLVTAPEQVAAFLRGLRTAAALVGACARLRPDPDRGEAPRRGQEIASRPRRALAGSRRRDQRARRRDRTPVRTGRPALLPATPQRGPSTTPLHTFPRRLTRSSSGLCDSH